jgi:D-glycero-alpha-D-manno-heptose-7-phosphate kinase
MIISRTPFRISFFGGGTDYPAWYRTHGGSVLVTTIDKYCYLSCRYYPPFFEHKFRIVYIKSEDCKTVEEISHPAVREILRYLKWDRGVEIHHVGDLPARGGMGSSSSFTVGLLHGLYAMQGKMLSKKQLAMESIHIEQEILRETVGSQDQVSTAYGGLNHIIFQENGEIVVKPVTLSQERVRELESHLMLFYTGIKRTASNVAQTYVNNIEEKNRQLQTMMEMVDQGIAILNSNRDIDDFGRLLHEAWKVKSSFSNRVSNSSVDEIYTQAMSAGAIGGKITGAGGGGFMLLFVPLERKQQVREKLNSLVHVPFRFEGSGSQIIFYDPEEDFTGAERERATLPIQGFRELEPY